MTQIVHRTVPEHHNDTLLAAGLSPLMARLLAARNITHIDQLDASLANLLAPNTLSCNEAMANLLADAIEQKKNILVIGDYDADGATATAVAVKGLRTFGANIDFLVPNRFEYGYGLTPEIVALAATRKPDIIITVDNGIASVDGVAAANLLGIQVLITDHHLPGLEKPNAACIINPNQHGCEFASKNLAGVGVIFYGLLCLRAELRKRGAYDHKGEPNLTGLLDLVALGTVADLVKLDDNNRILVEQGLRRIRAGTCSQGILALLQVSGRPYQTITAQDLGFYVGPRLNAAGRLDDMTLGIQCLLADNEADALDLANQLHELNLQRRGIEADMQDSANYALETLDVSSQYTISMYQPDWHQGVIGILASRLKEHYHRPVIVFADAGDGLIKGSGRSIASLHLRDALDHLSKLQPDLLLKFGGHAMAAGLTIRQADFERFQAGFETVVRSLILETDLESMLEVDGSLHCDDFNIETVGILDRQVWGQGFAPPVFFDTFDVLNQRVVGEKHLKLSLKLVPEIEQAKTPVIDAIYFNRDAFVDARIQAAYQLQINEYNGTKKVQLSLRYVVS